MSLRGAKLICLSGDDDGQFETIQANGKCFKFGYYMDCDVVLKHPDAMGLHCIINCDAFGRVTIENLCSGYPITLDGKTLLKTRPLLNDTEICILDRKYLWQFDGNSVSNGSQKANNDNFTTPSKEVVKGQQPPNSEPPRKWWRPMETRFTIHSFAYCIKPDEIPQNIEEKSNENQPLNIDEQTIETVSAQNKCITISSPTPSENVSDFIDLKTPKLNDKAFGNKSQLLVCCRLSETLITSYSPRQTGTRPEKSFAVVQSPLAAHNAKLTNVSLGLFNHIASPQTALHNRSSMHLIDLITPKKNITTAASPSLTLLKSTLKNNLPKGTSPTTPQKSKNAFDVLSTPESSETVYSVRSTDDESVIIVSDDGSGSPLSPAAKTPHRPRTPQSLMKRAILSSAKKASVSRKLLVVPQLQLKQLLTPEKSKNKQTTVRFQSQSTPQRKSSGRLSSSIESISAGKPRKPLITSTPFRQRADIASSSNSSRRSLTISSNLDKTASNKKESRNSIMLRQALSTKSAASSSTHNKPEKSVLFLEKVDSKVAQSAVKVEDSMQEGLLNRTFSIEEDAKYKTDIESAIPQAKDATFSPEKVEHQDSEQIKFCDTEVSDSLPVVPQVANISDIKDQQDTGSRKEIASSRVLSTESGGSEKIETSEVKKRQTFGDDTDYDLMDEIFKTPKARNIMILSSPKSIGILKPTSDSVELIHSTDFDISGAKLDELFQTPQSELITRPVERTPSTIAAETLSSEEAFDLLTGRPITRKSYARGTPLKKPVFSAIKISTDSSLPKTDIDEWIDSVNDLLDDERNEAEMSYLTHAMGDITRDPLMMQSVTAENSNTKDRIKLKKSPKDECEMTIREENEDNDKSNLQNVVKDPLEATSVSRSLSPNISGIGLLDHTSESIFSETLVVSDDSSLKETTDKTFQHSEDETKHEEVGLTESKDEKTQLEIEEAFKTFEMERKALDEKRLSSTPEGKRYASRRTTRGNKTLSDEIDDFQDVNAKLVQSEYEKVEEFKVRNREKRPEPEKHDNKRTLERPQVSEVKLDLQAAKAEKELELAFDNFEEEPEFSEQRTVKTPEPEKKNLKDHRRTLGSALVSEVKLDLQAAKAERELQLAFENFEEEPEFSDKRIVKTPEPEKRHLKDHRRTLGSALVSEVKLDFQAAKAERELELAFENFEEEPEFSEQRSVKTPEPEKKNLKHHRRTMGSALVSEMKLDLQAAKAERELELAFENFEEEPEFSEKRTVKTPEPEKNNLKYHRRTMGSAQVSELKLDLQVAKAERELELAFENFEEEPEFSEKRIVKTPEPEKKNLKDHRRTMGSALVSEVKLDLQAAKAERELELAFENFEEEPEFSEKRNVKTPEPEKKNLKDHRRTMGSALVSEEKLDLQAAKAERELELAFENFEEEPEFSEKRSVKTPEPARKNLKDHRRTLGSALVSEVKVNLQAAKAERELELAFENFKEEPEFSEKRTVKTPEPEKKNLKDHRRTMGSALVLEVKLDLQAAKAERELELAFENFEEEPEFSEKRNVKTPEPEKKNLKDHRRTMGSALVSEVKLDLQAAKAERELELAFENFEEEPEFSEKRNVKTPEPEKKNLKDHRRTMGSALVSEKKLDLQAAKAERELELAFENFAEEPEFSEKRSVKTPEPEKKNLKDHRRTMGSALVSEVKLDLQAATAERELELAFENFKEEPEFSEKRTVKTPEPEKKNLKDHRRTMGSALVLEVKLDLQAAKAERELELALENFEEEPEFSEKRNVKTPEPEKKKLKDHRRTLGSELFSEVKLDLQAAKAERELELAFENFEEEPESSEKRTVKTPEPEKKNLKDHRRTMGSALVSEVKLDLQVAKAEKELELAFENFEEEPEFSGKRIVKTPEPGKRNLKDHRRTMGSALVSEVKLDLQAAKAERELELAFENFEEEPEFSEQRTVKTPEPGKKNLKDHRRTMGSALVAEVKLDLQAAIAERELELAFENFEEEPEFSEKRTVKTPEPEKKNLKDHRRTMGSALVSEVKLDLQVAKAEKELELAFENFEEEPEFSGKRIVKTPEPEKRNLKDHRRTMGSALVSEVKLDLQAAKAERELELAFENFEEEPEFSQQRTVKTPELDKKNLKDHRRTMGSALVSEVKLDLQAAKAERELELAFENFEEEPEFSEKRTVKTPEPEKKNLKDHRRTMGSALVSEVKLDLQAAKAERELELAFENFEEEPEFSEQRTVKTPEPEKKNLKDHRRTMGSALVSEVELDLQTAKAERELELAFENLEEQPEFSEKRTVKIPEPEKKNLKDLKRTMGGALLSEVKLDLKAAKAERAAELACKNFEEATSPLKDCTRTLGSGLVSEIELDLQVAKTKREVDKNVDTEIKVPQPTEKEVQSTRQFKDELEAPESTSLHRTRKKLVQKFNTSKIVTPVRRTRQNSTELFLTSAKKTSFSLGATSSIAAESIKDANNETENITQTQRIRKQNIQTTDIPNVPILEAFNEDIQKKSQANVKDDESKSLLNLRASAEEIIDQSALPLSKHIRGRRAQLSVVLIESNDKKNLETEQDQTYDDLNMNTVDIIPSTPLPISTRGRRPSKIVEGGKPIIAPSKRNTRNNSAKHDTKLECFEVEKIETPAEEQLTDADWGDIIVSTPLQARTRRRKNFNQNSSETVQSKPKEIVVVDYQKFDSKDENEKHGILGSKKDDILEEETSIQSLVVSKILEEKDVQENIKAEIDESLSSEKFNEEKLNSFTSGGSRLRGRRGISKQEDEMKIATPKRRIGRPRKPRIDVTEDVVKSKEAPSLSDHIDHDKNKNNEDSGDQYEIKTLGISKKQLGNSKPEKCENFGTGGSQATSNRPRRLRKARPNDSQDVDNLSNKEINTCSTKVESENIESNDEIIIEIDKLKNPIKEDNVPQGSKTTLKRAIGKIPKTQISEIGHQKDTAEYNGNVKTEKREPAVVVSSPNASKQMEARKESPISNVSSEQVNKKSRKQLRGKIHEKLFKMEAPEGKLSNDGGANPNTDIGPEHDKKIPDSSLTRSAQEIEHTESHSSLPSKTRGRKGAAKDETIETCVKNEVEAQPKTRPEETSRKSGRRAPNQTEPAPVNENCTQKDKIQENLYGNPTAELTTPNRRGGRTRSKQTHAQNAAMEPVIENPKLRGRKAKQTTEKADSPSISTSKEKRTRTKIELLNESLTSNTDNNSPRSKRIRKTPVKLDDFVIGKLVQNFSTPNKSKNMQMASKLNTNADDEEKLVDTPQRKDVHLSPVSEQIQTKVYSKSTPEDKISQPKRTLRGRALSVTSSPSLKTFENQKQSEMQTKPTRGRGKKRTDSIQYDSTTVDDSPASSSKQTSQKPALKTDLDKEAQNLSHSHALNEEENQEKNDKRRPKRAGPIQKEKNLKKDNISKEQTLKDDSKETKDENKEKRDAKPRRGRNAANKKLEETKEEEEVIVDRKLRRGRKLVNETSEDYKQEDIPERNTRKRRNSGEQLKGQDQEKSENQPEKKPGKVGQISNSKAEDLQERDMEEKQETKLKEKPDNKPKRGRNIVATGQTVESPHAIESSPFTKRTTRGRKAPQTINENESDVKLEQKANKSANIILKRKNLDVPTSDDQQDTPTKRTRRKPIKLCE